LLIRAERAAGGPEFGVDAAEQRLGAALTEAAARADFAEDFAQQGGTVAELRRDLPPRLAERLGLTDIRQPLTKAAVAHMISARRCDGAEIEGRTRRSPSLSVAEVFGLPAFGPSVMPPRGRAVANILAGRRADGASPTDGQGAALPDKVVAGARKRFLAIYEVPAHREPTAEEVGNMTEGKLARGLALSAPDWRHMVNIRRERVTFLDLTFSADKSLSVAWALAPTPAERALLLDIHRAAVTETMQYVEQTLGQVRRGDGGRHGTEQGQIAWITFNHFTSRPTVDIERVDKEGRSYTDFATVPLRRADPQVHSHAIVPNVVLTENGHVGSMDLDEMAGRVKEFGAVYQAFVANGARRHGIEVLHDETTGAARLTAIPDSARQLFSKRTAESEQAARDFAAGRDLEWDTLSGDQRIALMKAGASELRHAKDRRSNDAADDFSYWRGEAGLAGYHHRSVLRPDDIQPELAAEQRYELAYEGTQRLIETAFQRRAAIGGQDLREIAARGLIRGGIDDPSRDIAAVLHLYRDRGVLQDGQPTSIAWARADMVRGKIRWGVTTGLHEEQERELTGLVRSAAADRSASLAPHQIERAASAFLDRHKEVDRQGEQWRAQREMMQRLGSGGRLSLGIGVAGAGKSTVVEALVDAWRDDRRHVFGATLAWRQTATLTDAGIDPKNIAAIDPFLRRAAQGEYELDQRSVIVVDEIALVGSRQMLDLARLQGRHGFQLVMLGDPKQSQSVEAPAIGLLTNALGPDAIPEILTSARQKLERDRETTLLWREGRAAEALERKMEDGDLLLVAGGRAATIRRIAAHWQERRQEGEHLLVVVPTNEDVRDVGLAIREQRPRAGDLGDDLVVIRSIDRNTGQVHDMALAAGDRVRTFERIYDADAVGRRRPIANNGDPLEIRSADTDGLVVRNELTGVEGTVLWAKLQRERGGQIGLGYAYASTIHIAQSQGAPGVIWALPDGSRSVNAFSAYTAASRQEYRVSIVVNEAAERRHVHRRQMLGTFEPIREANVIRNLADNLSRQPEKITATDLLSRAGRVYRGTVRNLRAGVEPLERARPADRPSFHRMHEHHLAERSPILRRLVEHVRELRRRVIEHYHARDYEPPTHSL
jgi:TrwC relaxase/AAA domain